jgi:hypothetical protein
MQMVLEVIVWGFLQGVGHLAKKVFGIPRSESGISETWLGTGIVVTVIAVLVYYMRG